MRVHISLTDDNGAVFEGDADLTLVAGAPGTSRRRGKSATAMKVTPKAATAKLDFAKSERAFIKAYARDLSGARKFVLLVAFLAKGQVGKEVELSEVQKHWNKMTSNTLLGCKFNRFYSNTAKDDGWVDTTRKGVYVLTAEWKGALSKENG